MPACDLCGKEAELYMAEVEGSLLNVCKGCSSFGRVIKKIELKKIVIEKKGIVEIKVSNKELIEVISRDYARIIKEKREKLGLTQMDFAKKISEKESLVHKIEIGQIEPSLQLARKLEKFLKVKLVETHEEIHGKLQKVDSDKFTIGDFIKIKKKDETQINL